jgi:hypothetical protein
MALIPGDSDPAAGLRGPPKGGWLPGLAGALASFFLLRSVLLGMFFLVPLGLTARLRGRPAVWRGLVLISLLNAAFTLGAAPVLGRPFAELLPDLGYFFLTVLAFIWLMAPPESGPWIFRIRALYRLILGAMMVGLLGIGFFFDDGDTAGLGAFARSQAELLSSLAADSAGGDAVRRSILEQELSPRRIMAVFNMVLLRGGILASSAAVLFFSRQLSLGLAALIARRRGAGGAAGAPVKPLKDFHVPPFFIWVFSCSLGGILLFRLGGLSAPETVLWNLLTVCALLYLAQGFGIARFFLSRRELPALMRFLLNLGIVLAVLSPGINMAVLVVLTLLGIAEYWLPLRRAGRTEDSPAGEQ